jgi:small GTP-binding protein
LTKGVFPLVYVPTVFENYVGDYEINNKPYEVGFWDTAGQEDYDRVRPLSYPDSDAIIISFSIDSPDSLANVEERVMHSHKRRTIGPSLTISVDLGGQALQPRFTYLSHRLQKGLAEGPEYDSMASDNEPKARDV